LRHVEEFVRAAAVKNRLLLDSTREVVSALGERERFSRPSVDRNKSVKLSAETENTVQSLPGTMADVFHRA